MSASGKGHSHGPRGKSAGGPDDGGEFDWFAVLDVAVWAAVAVIAFVGIEWLIGRVIRENMAAGASKYLKQHAQTKPAAE